MVNVIVAVIHLIVIVAVAFQFYRREQTSLRKFFWPALALKLISGICLGLLYTHYYSVADTFAYFKEASTVASLAKEDFLSYVKVLLFSDQMALPGLAMIEPRAAFMIRLTSIFNLITGDNYWAVGFYFSFISFLGTWFLVRVISQHIPAAALAAVIAFLFLPSVVFWTSGLLKESLAMAALFFLTGVFLEIWFNERVTFWNGCVAVLCFWIFWKLKYYYAGVFVATVCTTLVYKGVARKRFSLSPGAEAIVWIGILTVPLVVVSFLHPNFHFDRLFNVIVVNNAAYNSLSAPDNIVHFRNLTDAPVSILQNAPWALFSGLFRPLCWEVSSVIQFLQGVENTFLLLLFVASCLRFKIYFTSPHRPLILCLVVYVIILCVFLTLSAPNFGTLSRYRTGYISFFAFIIFCNNPVFQYVERSITRLVST